MVDDIFSERELERYYHHISLPHFGLAGQRKVKQSAVLIVGLGGLGSTSALLLASAGVGQLGLIDDDRVKLGNLPRQFLYNTEEIGMPKVTVAKKRLLERNPDVMINVYNHKLTEDNAIDLIKNYDLVVDGTDNLSSRRLINKTCAHLEKPYIFGAVDLYDGQVSVFWAKFGPCLACLFPKLEVESSLREFSHLSVLSTLPAIISTLQAAEALKLITGIGKPLIGRLLMFNAQNSEFQTVEIEKRASCKICGTTPQERFST